MSPKEMTTIRLEEELLKVMREVKEREGIPVTKQVDLAMREWLKLRGFEVKTERKRASTRKRS